MCCLIWGYQRLKVSSDQLPYKAFIKYFADLNFHLQQKHQYICINAENSDSDE